MPGVPADFPSAYRVSDPVDPVETATGTPVDPASREVVQQGHFFRQAQRMVKGR